MKTINGFCLLVLMICIVLCYSIDEKKIGNCVNVGDDLILRVEMGGRADESPHMTSALLWKEKVKYAPGKAVSSTFDVELPEDFFRRLDPVYIMVFLGKPGFGQTECDVKAVGRLDKAVDALPSKMLLDGSGEIKDGLTNSRGKQLYWVPRITINVGVMDYEYPPDRFPRKLLNEDGSVPESYLPPLSVNDFETNLEDLIPITNTSFYLPVSFTYNPISVTKFSRFETIGDILYNHSMMRFNRVYLQELKHHLLGLDSIKMYTYLTNASFAAFVLYVVSFLFEFFFWKRNFRNPRGKGLSLFTPVLSLVYYFINLVNSVVKEWSTFVIFVSVLCVVIELFKLLIFIINSHGKVSVSKEEEELARVDRKGVLISFLLFCPVFCYYSFYLIHYPQYGYFSFFFNVCTKSIAITGSLRYIPQFLVYENSRASSAANSRLFVPWTFLTLRGLTCFAHRIMASITPSLSSRSAMFFQDDLVLIIFICLSCFVKKGKRKDKNI